MQYLISKALRYGPCVIKWSQFYLPPTHETYLLFTPEPQGVTALWLVPTYTAWWTEAHSCEKLSQSFYSACPAESQTHDLLIASLTLYRQRHDAVVQWSHQLLMYWYVQMRVRSQQPQTTGQDTSVKLDPATDRSLLAYAMLNKFLQNYIDHVSCISYCYSLKLAITWKLLSIRWCSFTQQCIIVDSVRWVAPQGPHYLTIMKPPLNLPLKMAEWQ